MGRTSKLTEKQWAEIDRRLISGESAAALAKEFKVDRAAISRKFSQQIKTVKNVANQLLEAEVALHALPIAQQISAIAIADQMRSISGHMGGAANYSAATAHQLAARANAQVYKIDDANPMESQEVLQGISALTKMSNDASHIPLNLLKINKTMPEDEKQESTPIGKIIVEVVSARNKNNNDGAAG